MRKSKRSVPTSRACTGSDDAAVGELPGAGAVCAPTIESISEPLISETFRETIMIPTRYSIIPGILLAGLLAVTGAQAQYEEGTHFERIAGPDAGERDDGKVEVVEAFGYPCPACRNFLPLILSWEEHKPEHVEFRRLPVALGRGWDLFARGYYTAQVLDVEPEAHEALFRALHDENRQIRSIDDLAEFYSEFGVEAEEFSDSAKSFAVDSRMRQNANDVRRWGVRSTPTMIVNGKWRVLTQGAGTYEELLEVVDFLVEKERASAAGNGDDEPAP